MKQRDLNGADFNQWDTNGWYDEKFRLKLVGKHALVVAKWNVGGEWGVDLRRWSYHNARLLGEGIMLNSSTWKSVYAKINEAYTKGWFSGAIDTSFPMTIPVDDEFDIELGIYESNIGNEFLCINLLTTSGGPVYRARFARVGILVNFETIADFLTLSRRSNLV